MTAVQPSNPTPTPQTIETIMMWVRLAKGNTAHAVTRAANFCQIQVSQDSRNLLANLC